MDFAIYHNALNIDKGANHIKKIKSDLDKRGRLPLKKNSVSRFLSAFLPLGMR